MAPYFETTEISTHALREEGDDSIHCVFILRCRFLPTPSARRATFWFRINPTTKEFLPTPSARRATGKAVCYVMGKEISTHALREEGDYMGHFDSFQPLDISTHALREEGDGSRRRPLAHPAYFYPRPPRGGRRNRAVQRLCPCRISTHALREEGD